MWGFGDHAQYLIQRRFRTCFLDVLLSRQISVGNLATIIADGELATSEVEPFRSKRGFRQ